MVGGTLAIVNDRYQNQYYILVMSENLSLINSSTAIKNVESLKSVGKLKTTTLSPTNFVPSTIAVT